MEYSPIYAGTQYVNVCDIQEKTGGVDMPIVVNAVHFYNNNETAQSNIYETPKYTLVLFRTMQSPEKVKRFWRLRRDIVPTRLGSNYLDSQLCRQDSLLLMYVILVYA